MTIRTESNLDTAWETFDRVAAESAVMAAAERTRGASLAEQFRVKGYMKLTPSQALRLSDLAIVTFYRSLRGPGAKPSHAASPEWMLQSDFAFLNIRASSPDPTKTGRITDALKILPTMRVNG